MPIYSFNSTRPIRGSKMKDMLNFFSLLFARPETPSEPHNGFCEGAVRKIVSAHSHGNVRLQKGLYYTQQDVDARYARLRGTVFAD